MSFIEISHVTHCYDGGTQKALDDVSYRIEQGELFALLGSSGCGKSTLLNIVGGFIDPTEGSVRVNGVDILGLPSYKRNIGTVFQNYALFPHLSVFDNVAYGVRLKTRDKATVRKRVEECLALVRLSEYGDRMPHQLSGGQQQRVAIARALAPSPEILMLDEPMGNLDAQLRKDMQIELRAIQQRTGITTIMVTHDQEEAMTMADRIGIMRLGRVQQIGTPQEIYRRPANSFVATFLGKVNTSPATAAQGGGFEATGWTLADGRPVRAARPVTVGDVAPDEPSLLAVRPESIQVASEPGVGRTPVVVAGVVYVGSAAHVTARFEGTGTLLLELSTHGMDALPTIGQKLYVSWADDDVLRLRDVG